MGQYSVAYFHFSIPPKPNHFSSRILKKVHFFQYISYQIGLLTGSETHENMAFVLEIVTKVLEATKYGTKVCSFCRFRGKFPIFYIFPQ